MAISIRDRQILNTTIDSELLERLIKIRAGRAQQARELLTIEESLYLDNVIRYEGTGITGLENQELLEHFKNANEIERIVLTADCPTSINTNRNFGFAIEIRFDAIRPDNNWLRVSGPDHDWVERTYNELDRAIKQNANFHGFAKSTWCALTIQLLAVATIFYGSFWLSEKISRFVEIDNGKVILFIFLLLIFSNIWTPISQSINNSLNKLFPNALFRNRINNIKIIRFRTFIFTIATSIIGTLCYNTVEFIFSKLPLITN
ncbi:hypothetical protein [Thalassospira xiamenensis]|uniref:hypothetical protein n=1 Tax=Thalassospira xiamenensis TaxID=220697 RepID=UPI001FFED7D5|nr:hypothetical protein [Thalassospira xiamenensis]MCK2167866.1 hypothetical protein [Thalassospira xiamenensis]